MTKDNDFSKMADEELGYIEFIQANYLADDGQEKQHWYYLSVPPSKYEAFKKAEEQGNYDISDYGDILYHGPGTEPPEDIKKMMQETYGISDDFQDDLDAAVKNLRRFRPTI